MRFPAAALLLVLGACADREPRQGPGPRVHIVNDWRLTETAERDETVALDLGDADRLLVTNDWGATRVAAGDGPPQARCRLRLRAPTPEEAEAALAAFRVEAVREADGLRLQLVGEPTEIELDGVKLTLSASVDFDVTVPPGTALDVASTTGSVSARGPLGDVAVRADHGRVDVEGVDAGRVTVECTTGNVALRKVRADVIALATDHGSIELADVEGPLRVEGTTGNVGLEGFRGGACVLATDHGRVRAAGVFTELRVAVTTGNVEVRCRDGSEAKGDWRIGSDHGRVELTLPAGFSCELDARTGHGSISSDVAVLTKGAEKRGVGDALVGRMREGGARVELRTTTGNIRIREEG